MKREDLMVGRVSFCWDEGVYSLQITAGASVATLLMTSPESGCWQTGTRQRHWGPSRGRRTRAGAE